MQFSARTITPLPSFDVARYEVRQRLYTRSRLYRAAPQCRAKFYARVVLLTAVFAVVLQVSSPAGAEPTPDAAPSLAVQRIAKILEQIRARYVRPIDDQRLIESALGGVLKSLDSHSAYLDANAFRELQRDTQGEYGGLGLETRMDHGFMEVLSVLDRKSVV